MLDGSIEYEGYGHCHRICVEERLLQGKSILFYIHYVHVLLLLLLLLLLPRRWRTSKAKAVRVLSICDGLRRIPLVTPGKLSAGPIDASTEREGPSSRAGAFRGYGRTDGAMAFFGLASRKCSSFEHLRRSTDTRW